jgi:hypothetical protein
VGSGETEVLSNELNKERAGIDIGMDDLIIDPEFDLRHLGGLLGEGETGHSRRRAAAIIAFLDTECVPPV